MTKIEERAKEAYPTDNEDVAINRMNAYKRLGYIHGSTDQLRQDIEHAKAFAKQWLDEIINLWMPGLKNEPYYSMALNDIYRKLEKAMTHEE